MKKRLACMILVVFCGLSGCSEEDKEYELKERSDVKSEDCFICGEREDSLMPYFAKKDSVGLVHWNSFSVSDTEIRVYDEDGEERFEPYGNTHFSSFGDDFGSVLIDSMQNRGIANVKAYYEPKDEINFEVVKEKLCQNCLDQVVSFYEDQKNYGKDSRLGTTGFSFVDFQTKKLYTLSDPYRGYFIRDYYVSYNIVEDIKGTESRIEAVIFYAPERKV